MTDSSHGSCKDMSGKKADKVEKCDSASSKSCSDKPASCSTTSQGKSGSSEKSHHEKK